MAKQNNDLATKKFVKDTVKASEENLSKRIDGVEERLDKRTTKLKHRIKNV